jgi:hypothetical protein
MWRHVELVWTGVSEERIASIFRVEESVSEEPAWAAGCRLSHQCWLFSTGGTVCSHLLMLVPHWWIFLPWIWRRNIPLKRQYTRDLHGATSQKAAFCMNSTAFWGVMVCSLVEVHGCCRGTYRLHHQDWKVVQAAASYRFLAWFTLWPWGWRWYLPQKRW